MHLANSSPWRYRCLALGGAIVVSGLGIVTACWIGAAVTGHLSRHFENPLFLLPPGMLVSLAWLLTFCGYVLIHAGSRRRLARWLAVAGAITVILVSAGQFMGTQAEQTSDYSELSRLAMGLVAVAAICCGCVVMLLVSPLSLILVACELCSSVKPGFCSKCGYNLTGLRDPRCPECGTPFDPSLLRDGTGKQPNTPGDAKSNV